MFGHKRSFTAPRQRSGWRVGALTVTALLLASGVSPAAAQSGVVTDPADGVPRTASPVTYDRIPAVADPGRGAAGYFQPFWYDTDGRHIQAHGGQIVTVEEDGETVHYWYGEDRTNGYWNSPGVGVYRSTDLVNWTNMGTALRSVAAKSELTEPYFDALYDTVDDAGDPRTARIDELNFHLNTTQAEDYTAIFERPKVLYNAKNDQWVMWWHSDGRTQPGGSTYARSFAAVAVADNPAGPFRMTGAFRLYNRTNYQACESSAVPGQARDMTLFQDDDGTAYISYSSEENRSLYIAKLDDDYTNVEKTTDTDTLGAHQYSEDGRYPRVFADGTDGAPVRGTDFEIVKECGMLEAPALLKHDGTYKVLASGATGWAPNPQTYYTATDILGTWIRGVQAGDAYETVSYNQIPEGGDGLLSVGDTRRSTFGSQSTNVVELEDGKYVYMGDRWNDGASDSTYVWLPIVVGEGGTLEMRNPAVENPARWSAGFDESYWDDKGFGLKTWTVTDDRLPATLTRGADAASQLPRTVSVRVDGQQVETGVAWSSVDTSYLGARTITGILSADGDFTVGRTIERTIEVTQAGIVNVAPSATVSASSRSDLVSTVVDLNLKGKGWDDWSGSGYPRDSWIAFDWPAERGADSIVVHTFKDGATATWPSNIEVQTKNASGAWVAAGVSATVSQDAASSAPVVVLDVSQVAPSSALRLRLTSATNTWQSISEVQIWGTAPALNLCRAPGSSVAASFHQTLYATLPAANACDGNASTTWSTWAGSSPKDSATFTLTTAAEHRVNEVSFTNVEGTVTAVTVEYRDGAGQWKPTSAAATAVTTGTRTAIRFDTVVSTGLRLTFATPGSYLKIPEINVPEAPAVVAPEVSVQATTRCVAGKVVLTVSTTNESEFPVSLATSTGFGSKAVTALQPGKSTSAAFSTRVGAVTAGEATVVATGVVDGKNVSVTDKSGYASRTCG